MKNMTLVVVLAFLIVGCSAGNQAADITIEPEPILLESESDQNQDQDEDDLDAVEVCQDVHNRFAVLLPGGRVVRGRWAGLGIIRLSDTCVKKPAAPLHWILPVRPLPTLRRWLVGLHRPRAPGGVPSGSCGFFLPAAGRGPGLHPRSNRPSASD